MDRVGAPSLDPPTPLKNSQRFIKLFLIFSMVDEIHYSHTGGGIDTVDLALIFKIICYNLALVGVTIVNGA